MRIALALLVLAWGSAAFGLETARSLAASGATGLALARVETLQPREPSAPRWAEWEALRITLLTGLARHAEALQRVDALPAGMPRPQLRESLLAAARAGVASGQGAAARRHAARLLWQAEPSVEEARAARLAVIDSYVAERQGDPAFLAMLRFQQDYAPLERATAARFVEALIALDMDKHAVNWLASLDDASPVKLMLRMRTGLAPPDVVVGEARAALAKEGKTGASAGTSAGASAGYWRVLAEAAERRKDALLRIEALERLLDSGGESAAVQPAQLGADLWRAYIAGAQETANRSQMLVGDDAAWSDFAARRLAASPQTSRAFFAYLTQRGSDLQTRLNAQLQLVYSLQEARLERAALRLFEAAPADPGTLDVQARYLLGAMAERSNQPAAAGRYWKGLATPPGVNEQEWQVRLAGAYWRGGEGDAAVATLRALLGSRKALPAGAARQVSAVAQEMAAAGKADHADGVLRELLPLTDAREQRDILLVLGRIAEGGSRHQLAADYYLRSALLAGAGAPDAPAVQARLAAALNLSRAGYRDDARAQFEWVLKNAKDPAQLDIAKRELAKL